QKEDGEGMEGTLLSPRMWVNVDTWSCANRSHMGITCHYLDDNLKRKSCVLACCRMKFAHTYIEIAKTLINVHQKFKLSPNKVVGTVADNASNFGKAFRIFSFDKNETKESEYLQSENIVISEFELPNSLHLIKMKQKSQNIYKAKTLLYLNLNFLIVLMMT
ncbi:hypothetical protein ALC57_14171, partial [Trachymyrmex cornetzi]